MIEKYIVGNCPSTDEIELSVILHLRGENILVQWLKHFPIPGKTQRTADKHPEGQGGEIVSDG